MQLDIIDQKYSFKLASTKEYPFQTGNASVPIVSPQQEKQQDKETTQNLSLLSSIPPPSPLLLIQQPDSMAEKTNAVAEAY